MQRLYLSFLALCALIIPTINQGVVYHASLWIDNTTKNLIVLCSDHHADLIDGKITAKQRNLLLNLCDTAPGKKIPMIAEDMYFVYPELKSELGLSDHEFEQLVKTMSAAKKCAPDEYPFLGALTLIDEGIRYSGHSYKIGPPIGILESCQARAIPLHSSECRMASIWELGTEISERERANVIKKLNTTPGRFSSFYKDLIDPIIDPIRPPRLSALLRHANLSTLKLLTGIEKFSSEPICIAVAGGTHIRDAEKILKAEGRCTQVASFGNYSGIFPNNIITTIDLRKLTSIVHSYAATGVLLHAEIKALMEEQTKIAATHTPAVSLSSVPGRPIPTIPAPPAVTPATWTVGAIAKASSILGGIAGTLYYLHQRQPRKALGAAAAAGAAWWSSDRWLK
jgi:hypothetical protein